ncbi:MAG: TIGR01458 family HAD-type hydrolase [Synechococcus sp.]
MQAILIDLDGVIYQGEDVIPGAADTIAWLAKNRIPHLYLTNTTSRPRSALVQKLAGMGIAIKEQQILTPPVAAARWLAEHAPGPAALFVPQPTLCDFASLTPFTDGDDTAPASIVVGDLGEAWDFATLNCAFRLLMAKPAPAFVALGMTRYWRAPDGLRLDVAPFVAALECASGQQAVVLGKPAKSFFEAALLSIGSSPSNTVTIGDDIVGDVRGAQQAGLQGILVRTGKFLETDLPGPIQPDAVLDSIAHLPSWWRQQEAT